MNKFLCKDYQKSSGHVKDTRLSTGYQERSTEMSFVNSLLEEVLYIFHKLHGIVCIGWSLNQNNI